MSRPGRRSLRTTRSLRGRGLHTGHDTTITFCPAEAGQGVGFRRVDLPGAPRIPASLDAVHEVDRRTVLGQGDATIDTVEHVLAAVAGHEIDDLTIELDGPEPPILDGSAAPFFDALAEAGVVAGEGAPGWITVSDPVHVHEGDAVYRATAGPGGSDRIAVTVEWDHPLIGTQSASLARTPEVFANELAAARTFGFLSEVDDLRDRGLIKGAEMGCAVVLSDTDVVTGDLRWPDEFVRHKMVDLIGDLALLGARFRGTIEAFRPSHRGNIEFARAIHHHRAIGG